MINLSRPKILILGEVLHAKQACEALVTLGDIVHSEASSREGFLEECRTGKFDGVVAAYRTADSAGITGRFDGELIDALPSTWTYLASCGAGYDAIDVNACSRRVPPLRVANVPVAVNDATADTCIFLLLGALRNFNQVMLSARRGAWRGSSPPALGHDPNGKVLGILGYGGIGKNLALKATAFSMKVIYHSRHQSESNTVAEYVAFEELLKQSDVLSLNLPLNANTHHMISAAQLKMMKPSAIILNTARGPVLDEEALVQALDQGIISGAALDVFEDEPRIHPGLLKNERVILLPHMGTYTVETQKKMETWTIENVKSALEYGKLISPVPEQARL